jgi:hypothetical protein
MQKNPPDHEEEEDDRFQKQRPELQFLSPDIERGQGFGFFGLSSLDQKVRKKLMEKKKNKFSSFYTQEYKFPVLQIFSQENLKL